MSNGTPPAYPPEVQFIVDHHALTLGTWFCGAIGDFFLTGALVCMSFDYWSRYSTSDATINRVFVAVGFVLNIIKSAQTAAILWHKLIAGFGNYLDAAYSSPWYISIEPLTTEIVCFSAQVYFITRLWRMVGGLRLLLIPLVPSVLMGLAGHAAMAVQVFHLSGVDAMPNLQKTYYVALVGIVSSDIIVTTALSYYLWESRTGFKRTDNLIARLLHLTWITAALPMITSLLNLITYITLAPSGNSTFIAFNLIMPKLYTLSQMYTLNTRKSLTFGEKSDQFDTGIDRTDTVHTNPVRFTDARSGLNTTTSIKFAIPTSHEESDDSRELDEFTKSRLPVVV
ncbi:hypothetical protein EXIGLDRAFT_761569 [Exidia glandulosa HHB12029]|uniref:DUF6534 domain-containing protein n=1 Tax=Exidia glandulosa HHB12029 TaxID=1314781 RepID=A0A165NAT8_EXIGL|nr:hypothetical protein EXIGLDRAFT_761569 [Exidia glandulosa HHB12029]